MNGFIQ